MVYKLLKADRLLEVLRKLDEKKEMTVTELYAVWRSSTFLQKWLPDLEKHGYVACEEIQWGSRKFKKCRITEKGRRLIQLLEELKRLDEA